MPLSSSIDLHQHQHQLPLRKILRPASLWQLHCLGFKIVLLGSDRTTPIEPWSQRPGSVPWSKEEFKTKIVDRLYDDDDPSGELITAVATTFGETHLKDSEGKTLYLNCFDIDSLPIFQTLEKTIEWCRENTYVTRTYKSFGHHIFWLSHQPNPHIGKMHMRNQFDAAFEVKTAHDNGSALCHLPPSPHRKHPDFHYYPVGRTDHIMVNDEFYFRLLRTLQTFLKSTFVWSDEIKAIIGEDNITVPKPSPDEVVPQRFNTNSKENSVSTSRRNSVLSKLPESGQELDDNVIAGLVETLLPYIHEGSRDDFYFHVTGYLHKSRIAYGSAKTIVERLTAITNDKEWRSRLNVLKTTYKKHPTEVCGSIWDLLNTLKSLNPNAGRKEG